MVRVYVCVKEDKVVKASMCKFGSKTFKSLQHGGAKYEQVKMWDLKKTECRN